MNTVELSLFSSRISAVCDEMGALLQRAAFSPNIRDRLDFSCAVFDSYGELCAQAAHIPVHLGSMAYAMRGIIDQCRWRAGDVVVLNDPYMGGTHLPDVTVVSPVFVDGNCIAYVANRAHHADIGSESPGSMPISRSLADEGMIIPPTHMVQRGRLNDKFLEEMLSGTANPHIMRGDFSAQLSANELGVMRLQALIGSLGVEAFNSGLEGLNDYAERLATENFRRLPEGQYSFSDVMDDDGLGNVDIPIHLSMTVSDGRISLDFAGTAQQVPGNINCPLSVTAAAVYYVFRCLLPPQAPSCAGSFRSLEIKAPAGSLLNARRPAAVAAGNVETSTRIVDVVLGALAQAVPDAIPAASHGSMNNLAMGARGARNWDYYETLGGGMGAGARQAGMAAVQTHMTNTLNTPVEVLERHFPLSVVEYAIRRGSGGSGLRTGGDGLVREYHFLSTAMATVLTERRRHSPWGLAGGGSGKPGQNFLNGELIQGKQSLQLVTGDRLRIETPGGGGWGSADAKKV